MSKDNKATPSEQQDVQSFTGANTPPIAEAGTPGADEKITQLKNDISNLQESVKNLKEQRTDFVALVTFFGGMITFLTVEFQFLKTVSSGERIIGFSMLLWSLLLSLNITPMFLLDNSQGELFLKKAKRYWFLVVFIAINFCGGIFFIIRSNEEIARENKIYARFSGEYDDRLSAFEKRLRTLQHSAALMSIQSVKLGL